MQQPINFDQLIKQLFPSDNNQLKEAADALVDGYAIFLASLLSCKSMGEVDAIVTESPLNVKLNHRVQYFIKLHRKGLVELSTDPIVFASLNHPIAQYISEHESKKLLAISTPSSIDDVIEDAIMVSAASHIVGGVFAYMDVEWMESTDLNLLPDIKRTFH